VTDQRTEELSPLKRAIVEIRDLKARLADTEARAHEPIALIGMGMRLPGGADDPVSFWRMLHDGVDAITEVPAERWSIDELYDPDPEVPGRMAIRHGGFLRGVDEFDAAFFGISPREAETIDPQQRLLLEVTWEALEHAGIAPDRLFGGSAGVFVGISNSDHYRLLLADRDKIDTYTTTGNAPSVAAGRLSYVLGAQGPALSVDTACSSSLVAVHLAVRSLRARECDLALAGGVNLILTPDLTINFSRARMMAADGRCKTFDAAADGYVRSEGCAVVVLKRLSDALVDGDRVLAVVRGSAVNQDGRSGGLTAPNGPAQERVISAALADAQIAPEHVGYVEAHGTGTPLGDPIEVRALASVLGTGRRPDQPLLLGSVKTNLGHLEAAAGVAGLIKAVLVLGHGTVAPHLHLRQLNPHIAADAPAVAIPTVPTPWTAADGRRVAGVSSFGLSGTNAHVVLAEAPAVAVPDDEGPERPAHVLAVSARTPEALRAVAAGLAGHLEAHLEQALADVAFTANTGRSHLEHRAAIVAADRAGAQQRLQALAAGDDTAATAIGAPGPSAPQLAFLFTGHGSHHAGMGRQLYQTHPLFRSVLDRCSDLLRHETDRPLLETLFQPGGLDDMAYAQPALFSLQIALAELWRSWGVEPSFVAGHSAGEYAAAVVAGVMSLEEGVHLIAARGRLMRSLTSDGEMVAVFAEEADVARAVAAHASTVGIAAVNGPTTTVISGDREGVRAVLADLALDPTEWRRLDISVAAHSPLVEPILDALESVVAGVALSPPQLPLVSSMTGRVVDGELTRPGYWRRHLREPVRFASVFDTLRAEGCSTFLEIGPHPTLLALGQRCWPDGRATWAPSLRQGAGEWDEMLAGLAALYAAGVRIDWTAFDRPYRRRKQALPTYPFQRERHWSPAARPRRQVTPGGAVWPAAARAAALQAEQGPLDLQLDTWGGRWERLDTLATGFISAALADLGLFTRPGECHRPADLVLGGQVASGHERLVARWLGHLADDGLLERSDDGAFTAVEPLPDPRLEERVAEARSAFAGSEPLLAYLVRCGTQLVPVVTGQESALTTLFPDGSYETVDFLYSQWAVARYFNGIVRAAAGSVAEARPGEPIRVLELGAGTGGTTAAVLPGLPVERTRYTFTDVSEFFLARAAARFDEFPFVRYELLDIERPPTEQGFAEGAYDVVVAANVLHATGDLDAALGHARALLAPGGALVAYEATQYPRWFDVTTALIEGWQRFGDRWRSDHPLLTSGQWSEALTAAGFTEVVALPSDDQPTTILGHHVVLARAPGDPAHHAAREDVDAVPDPARAVVTDDGAAPAFDADELTALLPDERRERLVDLVRRSIARVLRMPDPTRLQRDQPLLDLGFDSLMAVELRDVLRRSLALQRKLPATLVFDHPSINAIAAHLEQVVLAERGMPGGSPEDGSGRDAADSGEAAARPTEAQTTDADAIAELSDSEVEALLLQKLAEIQ